MRIEAALDLGFEGLATAASEADLNRIFHSLNPAFVVAISPAGKTIAMNRTMLRALGYTAEEVAGKDYLSTFVPEEERATLAAVFAANVQEKQATVNVNHILAKDGRRLLVEWHSSPVGSAEGRIDFFFGLGLDITARQAAEKALRDSERIFRTLFESANDAIFLMKDGLFVECNRKTLEIFDCTREQILNQPPHRFSPPKQPDGHDSITLSRQSIQAALGGKPQFFEWVHCRYDGAPFYAEVSLNLVEQGDQKYLQAIVRDIDARKKAELALREARDTLEEQVQKRTAELRTANEEIRKFASIISHDLRAPLVNLRGFVGELRGASQVVQSIGAGLLPSLAPETQEEYRRALDVDIPESLDFIEAAAARMDALTSALLKLARLGHRPLTWETLNMNQLVGDLLATVAHQIEERQARIRIDSLPAVTADRFAMEQILANLLDNAIKFLPPEKPGEIRIRAETTHEETIFHVEDNGRGIPAEARSAVFEIFRRFGPTDVPGEGMGLSYVQVLVQRHGGRIWCESEPGSGSRFSFTLPHAGQEAD
jgi:PAS domain S-box-containing protein